MATHSRILAWEISWTEEPGGLKSTGLQKIWTCLSDWACIHSISRISEYVLVKKLPHWLKKIISGTVEVQVFKGSNDDSIQQMSIVQGITSHETKKKKKVGYTFSEWENHLLKFLQF